MSNQQQERTLFRNWPVWGADATSVYLYYNDSKYTWVVRGFVGIARIGYEDWPGTKKPTAKELAKALNKEEITVYE